MATKNKLDKKEPKKKAGTMVLTNNEIFNTREPLAKLMEEKLHVRVSYNLAKLASVLQVHLKVITETRDGVIKKYGSPNPENPQQISVLTIVEKVDDKGKVVKEDDKPVMVANPDFGNFVDEVAELMAAEETVDFGKLEIPVKLPEKVACSCEKCKHNMDRPLEIEPGTLLLLEKFVTLD